MVSQKKSKFSTPNESPKEMADRGMRQRRRIRYITSVGVTLGTLLIAAILTFFVLRPARSDMCASEILTNGRGVSINLRAKTFTVEGETKEVAIQRISERTALVIDGLSRLCRERHNGTVDAIEYSARFDKLVLPLIAETKATTPQIPTFTGYIDVVGYSGNEKLIRFFEKYDGKIVQISAQIDASDVPISENWEYNCFHSANSKYDLKLGDITTKSTDKDVSWVFGEDKIFNRDLPLPIGDLYDNIERFSCERYKLRIVSDKKSVFSSGGVGTLIFKFGGRFRIDSSVVSAHETFYLTELSAEASDFAN